MILSSRLKSVWSISSYFELYNWSIENIQDFWAAVWDFGKVIASPDYDLVVDDLSKFPGARWFVELREMV
jgi:acetoacetyl-CoA synthetase